MDKDTVDKKLKHGIELFKVYAIFIIALGTGNIGLFLRNDFPENSAVLSLFIGGVLIFFIFVWIFIQSFIKINRLYKKL